MHNVVYSTAIMAIASRAVMAGVADSWAPAAPAAEPVKFVDGDWEDKCEGESFPIKWSEGNGKTVAVTVKNGEGWAQELCADEKAGGELDWEIEIPKCDIEYSVWIKQEECEELESPKFYINCVEEEGEGEHGGEGGWGKPSVTSETAAPTWTPAPDCKGEECWKHPEPATETESCTDDESWSKPAGPDATGAAGWGKDGKPVAPAETSADAGWGKDGKPVAPAETSADAGWNGGKPVAPAETSPAAASSEGWNGGKPVAPAETSAAPAAAASGDWNKPVAPAAASPASPVDAYHGAATKIGGSVFALAAVFATVLLL